MDSPKTSELYDLQASRDFYEERYDRGYMEEWSIEKKQRIFEVIRSIGLPEKGDALDFGCGNGVLTEVIRQALPPAWNVYGTDLSAIAVKNARERCPSCTFFSAEDKDESPAPRRYDFLFTHHVLEHVYDLDPMINVIESRLLNNSAMLHILPCGNEDSFERSICLLRKDGINAKQHNRFFYEDEGHVRRLTGDQLDSYFVPRGFELAAAYYSYQYFGALDWVSQSSKDFISRFADPAQAVDRAAERKLKKLQRKLLRMRSARYPALLAENRMRKSDKTLKDMAILFCAGLLYPFSKPVDIYIKHLAQREWLREKQQPNGSEMYHLYRR